MLFLDNNPKGLFKLLKFTEINDSVVYAFKDIFYKSIKTFDIKFLIFMLTFFRIKEKYRKLYEIRNILSGLLSTEPEPKENKIFQKIKKNIEIFKMRFSNVFKVLFYKASLKNRFMIDGTYYNTIDRLLNKKVEPFKLRKKFWLSNKRVEICYSRMLFKQKILMKKMYKKFKYNIRKPDVKTFVSKTLNRLISCGNKKRHYSIFDCFFLTFSRIFKIHYNKNVSLLNEIYKNLLIRTAIKNRETKQGFKQFCTYLTKFKEIKNRINLFFFDLVNSISRKKNKKNRLIKVKDVICSNFLIYSLKKMSKRKRKYCSFHKVFMEISRLLFREVKFRGALKAEYRHYLLEMFFVKFRKFRRKEEPKKRRKLTRLKKIVKFYKKMLRERKKNKFNYKFKYKFEFGNRRIKAIKNKIRKKVKIKKKEIITLKRLREIRSKKFLKRKKVTLNANAFWSPLIFSAIKETSSLRNSYVGNNKIYIFYAGLVNKYKNDLYENYRKWKIEDTQTNTDSNVESEKEL
jgi:hypothetical protein